MKVKRKFFTFVIFSLLLSGLWAQESQSLYSLETLLDATNHNHPELLKLQEEYRRSLLDVKDAWWNLGPTVDFQGSGTYMVNPPVGAMYINADDIINSISWNGAKPRNSGQRIKVFDGMENTLYNFQIDITQPIFTWGKITNAIKLYNQISKIKQTQITQQTEQLETELKTRLISLYYMNRIIEILNEEQTYTDKMVEVSENAEKSGMLLHQDVVDAKIQAKELEIAQQDLLEQINDQLLELRRITGIDSLSLENIDYDFVPAVTENLILCLQKILQNSKQKFFLEISHQLKCLHNYRMSAKPQKKFPEAPKTGNRILPCK